MNRLEAYKAKAIQAMAKSIEALGATAQDIAAPPTTTTPAAGVTLAELHLPSDVARCLTQGLTCCVMSYNECEGDINCAAIFLDRDGGVAGKAAIGRWPTNKGKLKRAESLRDTYRSELRGDDPAALVVVGPELDNRIMAYVETKHGSWVAYLPGTIQPDGSTAFGVPMFKPTTPADGFHHILFAIHEPDHTRDN